jgi:preprotein translocase subunit Sec61beta
MAFGKRTAVALFALLLTACQTLGLVKRYEYDERVDLSLDGSAVVYITASIPALVALRGITLSVDPESRFDRQAFQRLYEGPGVIVREVSTFRRHGRRFVHARLDVDDIAQLPRLVPMSWSRYRLDRLGDEFRFVQEVGPAAQLDVGNVGWTGNELVAFRVHLPSRINFENSPLAVERGNIVAWEQTLRERLSGTPLRVEVRMQTESILYTTLWLFAGSFVAAMLVVATILWWISRKGRAAVVAP